MDRQAQENVTSGEAPAPPAAARRSLTRRRALRYGLAGAAGAAGAWWLGSRLLHVGRRLVEVEAPATGPAGGAAPAALPSAEVFKGGAPSREDFERWRARGWARPARHCTELGRNVRCGLCPNRCLLEPGDRGRCRNRVNMGGKLFTLAYGNPCAFNMDPIEKKPLLHFLPGTWSFSIATSGCCFRCLNCQNWDISQAFPEQTKDPRGPEMRLTAQGLFNAQVREYTASLSLFPEDVAAIADYYRRNPIHADHPQLRCGSVSYTYSEPTVFFEYMTDSARLVRAKGLKNVWVTCGSIQPEPLEELCGVIDAANVDLKSFDEGIYRRLNSGSLRPILDCLVALKRRGVWFEVTNLVVPTYTDRPDMIARMCGWLVENIGPDYPLHFSRFHPQHKLRNLPWTAADVLVEAREIARKAGLHHVYIGNIRGVEDAETTFCPSCKRPVVLREGFLVKRLEVTAAGKCRHCGGHVAGVWST